MHLFNRKLLIQKKNNIAKNFEQFNFLRKELSCRLTDHVDTIKRNFDQVLDINCNLGEIYELLNSNPKIGKITQADISKLILEHNNYSNKKLIDLENIDLSANYFDMVISVLGLHNVNTLENTIKSIYNILKPGGLFIFSVPIYGTLDNLSQALMKTELELYNSFSPRIHPFSDIKTLANVCSKSGFIDIVANKDKIEIMYKKFISILKDLKGMGEGNILNSQNTTILGKNFFQKLEQNFEQYKDPSNQHYKIEILYCEILAWKPN